MKTYILLFTFLFAILFRASAQTDEDGCVVLESDCYSIKYAGVLTDPVKNTAKLTFTVTSKCDVPLNYVLFQLPEGITPTETVNGNYTFDYNVSYGSSTTAPIYPFIKFTASENTKALFRNGESDVFQYTIPLDQFHKMTYLYTTISGGGHTFTICLNPKGCTAELQIPEPFCEITTDDGLATFGFIDAEEIADGFGKGGEKLRRTRIRFKVKNNSDIPIGYVSIETSIAKELYVAPTNALGQYANLYLWDLYTEKGYVEYIKINPEGAPGREEEVLTFIISTDTYKASPFFSLTMVTEDFATLSNTGFVTDGLGKCTDEPISALPVELSSFSGKATASGTELNWTTASEDGNDRFEVQRSTDGKVFTTIGTVKGAGNSASKLSYSYLDKNASKGTSYYRLNQVDTDGTASLSQVVAMENNSATATAGLSIYPNPASGDNLTIALDGDNFSDKSFVITISDINGRKVFEQNVSASDSKELNLSIANLKMSKGLYMVKVLGDNLNETRKLLINK